MKADTREGGKYTIIMHVGEDKTPHSGQYLEVSRPNKLVLTWEHPFSSEGSTVTLKFSEFLASQRHTAKNLQLSLLRALGI